MAATERFLKDVEVAARYGVSRQTVWRWTKHDPTFPRPVKLSDQATRFRLSELETWEKAKEAA
jgi:predicted DNA-binding transcriptional regulator AlpA